MNRVRLCRVTITIATGATMVWFISAGNSVMAGFAAIIGLSVLYLCKSRIQEAIEDERTYRISEKSSRAALRVFASVLALTSIVLVLFSGNAEFLQVGYILGYLASALIMLYLVSYIYYSWKYGGLMGVKGG